MHRLTPVALAFGLLIAIAVPSRRAEAMCGGNIFMTCPPSNKGAAPVRKRADPVAARPRKKAKPQKPDEPRLRR